MREQKVFDLTRSFMSGQTRGLEQATSFGPLPGEFIVFAQIAMGTCNDKVIDTVSRNVSTGSPRKGKGMIDVMFSPLNLFAAIVAFLFLTIILLTDLFRGMCTLYSFVTGASVVLVRFIACPCFGLTIVYFSLCLCFGLTVIGFSSTPILFSYFRGAATYSLPMSCSCLYIYAMRMIIDFIVSSIPFSYSGIIMIYLNTMLHFRQAIVSSFLFFQLFVYVWAISVLLHFFFHLRMVSIVSFIVCAVMLFYIRAGIISFASRLYFWTTKKIFLLGFSAFFAVGLQSIFSLIVTMKEFSSGRMPLIVFRAFGATFERDIVIRGILGYNVIHSKNFTFLLSCLGSVPPLAQATQYLPSYYIINQPLKQVQGVFL